VGRHLLRAVPGGRGLRDELPPDAELHWRLGYLYALALMVLTAVALHRAFKHRGWL
jgi:hypothetical protein